MGKSRQFLLSWSVFRVHPMSRFKHPIRMLVFSFGISLILYNSHHKSWAQSRETAPRRSQWPEGQKRHQRRRPGRRLYREIVLPENPREGKIVRAPIVKSRQNVCLIKIGFKTATCTPTYVLRPVRFAIRHVRKLFAEALGPRVDPCSNWITQTWV